MANIEVQILAAEQALKYYRGLKKHSPSYKTDKMKIDLQINTLPEVIKTLKHIASFGGIKAFEDHYNRNVSQESLFSDLEK